MSTPNFEKTPPEAQELIRKPIKDLGLKLEGSMVEPYVRQLYDEITRRGLEHFRPACYLTDQWGCPSEEPIIGIPFYLSDPRLHAVEKAVNDVEDESEIMMYMRHEAGHAFNYAYEFYKTEEWRELFGPFRRAYRDDYNPIPFSKKFVRHIAGWYAQKHPDEDFAETFAVWLTPGSNWKRKYDGWGAMAKLKYLDRVAKEVATTPPIRPMGEVDFTVEDMEATVEDFYRDTAEDERADIADLPLETDLVDIFPASAKADAELKPANAILSSYRKEIVDRVTYWTGVRRPLVKLLVEAIETKVGELGLTVEAGREPQRLIEVTTYATTLAMNYLIRGRFVHS